MSKKIVFRIRKDGEIEAEVLGVPGSKCMDYIDLIEKLTEGKIVDTEKTKEYYQQLTEDQSETIKNSSK